MKRIIIVLAAIAFAAPSFATTLTSSTVPAQAKVEIMQGKINFATDTLKMVLKVQASATTDKAAQATASTSTLGSYNNGGELATANGYTQGGQTLSGCTVSLSTQTVNFTCTAPTWTTTAALTFDYVEIYDASCATNGCTNANQVVQIIPLLSGGSPTSFTSATSGPFTVTLVAGQIAFQ